MCFPQPALAGTLAGYFKQKCNLRGVQGFGGQTSRELITEIVKNNSFYLRQVFISNTASIKKDLRAHTHAHSVEICCNIIR